MGLWKKLFGANQVIQNVYEKIVGEQSTFMSNADKVGAVKTLLQTYEPFKLAQRFLALTVVLTFLLVLLTAAGMMVWGGIVGSKTDTYLLESGKALAEINNETLGWPVVLILTFYFAGGAVEGIVSKVKRPTG